MTTKRMLISSAVTMVAAVSALAMWFAGAGTALAPEPAKLTTPLSGNTGSTANVYWVTAPAKYAYSGTDTTVVKWATSWTQGSPTPAAGMPCATTDLPAGETTYKTIQRNGSLGKCM